RRLLAALRDKRLIGRYPRLALRLARPRARPHPFEFTLQRAPACVFRLALAGEPRLFLLEPAGIIALGRQPVAAVQFEDPAGDLVEEIAVVRHGDDGAGVV